MPPNTANESQKAEAQDHYEKGVEHYKEKRFDEAAAQFHASFEVVASPNSHMMYARALREAGKLSEAYEEMALTQQEAADLAVTLPKYATAAESAEAEMKELLKRVAALRIQVVGAEPNQVSVYVGDRKVPPERWRTVSVQPGSVEVTARLATGQRLAETVEAPAGEVQTVTLDVQALVQGAKTGPVIDGPSDGPDDETHDSGGSSEGTSLKPFAYVAGGVGVLGMATFAVFGSMSKSTYSGLEDSCPNGVCPPDQQEEIDKGKSQQTIANVGLAVGIVGLAAGATLFVLDTTTGNQERARRGVRVGAGLGSVAVSGSF